MPEEAPMPPQTIVSEPEPDVVPYEPIQPVRPTYTPAPVVETTTYVVGRGDSLSVIAARYGLRTAELVALNNIADPNKIRLGQKLILPGKHNVSSRPRRSPSKPSRPAPVITAGASTYVVKSGDCLSVIAARHGCKTAALRSANNLRGDRIIVGQKLVIPGGASSAPSPRAPSSPAPTQVTPVEPVSVTPDLEADFAPIAPVEEPEEIELPRTVPVATDARVHTVAEGEDLLTIASQWNVSISELKRLNGLTDMPLVAGQKLRIP